MYLAGNRVYYSARYHLGGFSGYPVPTGLGYLYTFSGLPAIFSACKAMVELEPFLKLEVAFYNNSELEGVEKVDDRCKPQRALEHKSQP